MLIIFFDFVSEILIQKPLPWPLPVGPLGSLAVHGQMIITRIIKLITIVTSISAIIIIIITTTITIDLMLLSSQQLLLLWTQMFSIPKFVVFFTSLHIAKWLFPKKKVKKS